MKTRKVPMQFRIEPELLNRVDTAARKSPDFEGNRSQFIRRAINELLVKVEKKSGHKEAA